MTTPRIYAPVKFRGRHDAKTLPAIFDTGAPHCIIPTALAGDIGTPVSDVGMPGRFANGRTEDITETVLHIAVVNPGTKEIRVTALVSGTVPDPVVGLDAMKALGLEIDARNGTLASPNRALRMLRTAAAVLGTAVAGATGIHAATGSRVPGSILPVPTKPSSAGRRRQPGVCRARLADGTRCRYSSIPGNRGFCGVHRK